MGFLAPWFLLGLGSLALPVYLHLLKRDVAERVPFSSLLFFERSRQSSVKHRKIDYRLLLAGRLFLLLLLVLAFANPFIFVSGGAGDASMRLVVVDNSPSMTAGGVLDRAKREGSQLLAGLPKGARVQGASFDNRLRTPADLASLTPSEARGSLGEFAQALRALAAEQSGRVEVHYFSDFQKTSSPDGFAEMRLPDNVTLVTHKLNASDAGNWLVERVTAPRRVRDTKKARVEAVIASAATEEASRGVALEVNGSVVARKSVKVPAGGRASVAFDGFDAGYGFARCAVLIEESDTLAPDNRWWFAVEKSDPQPVFFAGQAKSALYIRSALEASEGDSYAIEPGDPGSAPAERYRFAILADAAMPAQSEAAWRVWVERGGALWIILGSQSARLGHVPVLGDRLDGTSMASIGAERYWTLGEADTAHPLIEKAGRWEGVRFYQTVNVRPEKLSVVARLTSGAPVLLEGKAGNGSVLVFASGADGLANDFPLAPGWVPFLAQAAARLSGQETAVRQEPAGAAISLKGDGPAAAAEVFDPAGRRAITLGDSAKGRMVELDRSGLWEVRTGGQRAEVIAVNVDRRESKLESLDDEVLSLWRGKAQAEGAGPKAASDRSQKAFGLIALALALLAALMEFILAAKTPRLDGADVVSNEGMGKAA